MLRMLGTGLALFLLLSCSSDKAPTVVFVVPDGYVGFIFVPTNPNIRNAPGEEIELTVPEDGRCEVITGDSLSFGGARTKSGKAIPDMYSSANGLADSQYGFRPVNASSEKGFYYFVGTRAQLMKAYDDMKPGDTAKFTGGR